MNKKALFIILASLSSAAFASEVDDVPRLRQRRNQQAPVSAPAPVAAPSPSAALSTDVCLIMNGSQTTYKDCDDNNPKTIDVCHRTKGCQYYTELPDDISDDVYIFQDEPNLSDKQVGDILSWLRVEVTQVKNPFCWRQSYGRGVGKPLTECPADKDKIGALCYSKCPSGYMRYGFDCHQVCPSDFRNDGLYCRKAEYAKWPWESCQSGFIDVVVACRPPTPNCSQLGLGAQFDLSCAKKIKIGDPTPMVCSTGLEQDAGLCYSKCKTGYHGVGPLCWQDCDSDQANCGAACAKTALDCGLAVADQVIAPLVVAANIATLGMTAAPAGAANTVKVGSKSYTASTTLGKAMLTAIDLLQTVSSPRLAKKATLLTRFKDWRTGAKLNKAITTVQVSAFSFKVISKFVRGFSDDFATITSTDINNTVNQKLSPSAAQHIKELWTRIQFDEMKEAYGWQIGGTVLDALALVDITGVSGVVAAYAKPICKTIQTFPAIM
jgi:hypothetical protein